MSTEIQKLSTSATMEWSKFKYEILEDENDQYKESALVPVQNVSKLLLSVLQCLGKTDTPSRNNDVYYLIRHIDMVMEMYLERKIDMSSSDSSIQELLQALWTGILDEHVRFLKITIEAKSRKIDALLKRRKAAIV